MAWISSQPGESVPGEGRVDEDALEVRLEPSSDLDLGACQLCEIGLGPRRLLVPKERLWVGPPASLLSDREGTQFAKDVVTHSAVPEPVQGHVERLEAELPPALRNGTNKILVGEGPQALRSATGSQPR